MACGPRRIKTGMSHGCNCGAIKLQIVGDHFMGLAKPKGLTLGPTLRLLCDQVTKSHDAVERLMHFRWHDGNSGPLVVQISHIIEL